LSLLRSFLAMAVIVQNKKVKVIQLQTAEPIFIQ